MNSLGNNVFKLLQAINYQYDEKLLYNTSQFYSKFEQRPITMYSIKKAIVTEDNYTQSVELFRTTYRLHIVFFLRDYLYRLSGTTPPYDEKWEQAKEQYRAKKQLGDGL